MATNRILIVDDEEAIREVVSSLLEAQGYQTSTAGNGREALEALKEKPFDLVLSDMVMPEMDGLELLVRLREKDSDLPVVMVTAMHDVSTALEAIRHGAYDYILKPFEKQQLFLSVGRALEHRRVVVENRDYQHNLEKLVERRTGELQKALSQLEQSSGRSDPAGTGPRAGPERRRDPRTLRAGNSLHHRHCPGHAHRIGNDAADCACRFPARYRQDGHSRPHPP